MIYLEYGILALLTVFLSTKLAGYVDALDKKTSLSGAFIGGVLLAAVTSLPELFTSLTAVFSLHEPALVEGNVLGSNIFNLSILGVLMLTYRKKFMKAKIDKSNSSSLLFAILMYGCTIAALLLDSNINIFGFHVDIFTIILIIIYAISVKTMSDDNSEEEGTTDVSLTVKQIAIRFVIFALLLVAVSIILTQVSDKLSKELSLGSTVGGAIFLGVATSLPELSASVSLVKMNNFNASTGNIVGSCVFNFMILCFADILYTGSGIYSYNREAILFAGCGIVASLITYFGLRHKNKSLWVYFSGAGIVVMYLVSIVFSI
ncbi:cation:H+ antiporter [Breznakia sp. PF5-3]|uniref:sodium:calcium antiporter n=1 Tax=unclassified Breznakia TaxID=2623764 RepID=UPI002404FCD2|nr:MULTISPECIES: sodium:calcium antiporter [unclassified Breznakia]MDF9824667.1 cation:H+ antiporter [Breznakia sp. PM6-1]MDF9835652.1 cation:H+ antiporter [Breznakia sp. PF5-3]MDF9837683.1 cation:H+ antiporter [Breznakia sp. PFB2-8]MDF9859547.1 cation:H+ antiporter [Breznakia sp. PH5-24]